MAIRRCAIQIILACLVPLASSFGADIKLLKAVSDHFEVYTTDNEAAAKAILEQFEPVRSYLLKATGSTDPAAEPIRLFDFKSGGDFGTYKPKGAGDIAAFSRKAGDRVAIVVSGFKQEAQEAAMREYVTLVLNHSAPKLPYWLKLGFTELYCTLRVDPGGGALTLGSAPFRSYRATGAPDLNMSVLMSLKGGATSDSAQTVFDSQGTNQAGGTGGPGSSSSTRSSVFGAQDGQGMVAAGLVQDYPLVAFQLIHMLMFDKRYGPQFGAFVSALAGGAESVATLGSIYNQSLLGLGKDLELHMKMPLALVHPKIQLERPVAPQMTQLSAADSASLLAELKAAR